MTELYTKGRQFTNNISFLSQWFAIFGFQPIQRVDKIMETLRIWMFCLFTLCSDCVQWQFIRLCKYTQIMGRQQMRRGTVGENHHRATAAQVNTHLAGHFHKNCLMWASQAMVRCVNDGVTTMKPGHQTNGTICVICLENHKEAYNPECLASTVKHGGGSVMVWTAISWYSILLVHYPSWPNYCKGVRGQVG
jgi:hypothetical protein